MHVVIFIISDRWSNKLSMYYPHSILKIKKNLFFFSFFCHPHFFSFFALNIKYFLSKKNGLIFVRKREKKWECLAFVWRSNLSVIEASFHDISAYGSDSRVVVVCFQKKKKWHLNSCLPDDFYEHKFKNDFFFSK